MATIITLDNLELFKELSDEEVDNKLTSLQTTIEDEIKNLNLPIVITDSLPTAGKDYLNILYLIPSSTTGNNDIYEEYLCVEKNNAYSWEKFGSVSITEISSETTEGDGYSSTVVTGVSASGNKVTVTTDTLTASTLGALTTLTKSGTKDEDAGNNAISDIAVSGGTITITYITLATQDDIDKAVDAITAASLGALTSITSSGTKSDTDNVVTGVSASGSTVTVTYGKLTASDVGAASSSDLANYVPTTRTVNSKALSDDITLALTDLSDYSVASDSDIEALFIEKT